MICAPSPFQCLFPKSKSGWDLCQLTDGPANPVLPPLPLSEPLKLGRSCDCWGQLCAPSTTVHVTLILGEPVNSRAGPMSQLSGSLLFRMFAGLWQLFLGTVEIPHQSMLVLSTKSDSRTWPGSSRTVSHRRAWKEYHSLQ